MHFNDNDNYRWNKSLSSFAFSFKLPEYVDCIERGIWKKSDKKFNFKDLIYWKIVTASVLKVATIFSSKMAFGMNILAWYCCVVFQFNGIPWDNLILHINGKIQDQNKRTIFEENWILRLWCFYANLFLFDAVWCWQLMLRLPSLKSIRTNVCP